MAKLSFKIRENSSVPKYTQVVEDVLSAIKRKKIHRGDLLPTVEQICQQTSLARGTVIKAFKKLKAMGIIEAIHRRGYYVASEDTGLHARVFLLLDSLVAYKEALYNSFKETLGDKVVVDTYFHHDNIDVFKNLILDNLGKYNFYVIMPFEKGEVTNLVLDEVDPDKLLVLDRIDCVGNNYSKIGQDYYHDIYNCLREGLPLLRKYDRLLLVFPLEGNNPPSLEKGFRQFCHDHSLPHDVIHHISKGSVDKSCSYIPIDDNDLVAIIEDANNKGYDVGTNVGIVSYNDTPLKRIIGRGITTISTDWAHMGSTAANYVLNGDYTAPVTLINPTSLIIRGSL